MIRSTEEVPFRDLVESSPAIVYLARADGSIAYVNPAWTTLTGLPCTALIERGWPAVVHPDDRGQVAERWLGAMDDVTPFRLQFRIGDGTGEPRWVVSQAIPVFDPEGHGATWYGTVYEIVVSPDADGGHEDGSARAARQRAILARLTSAFNESLDIHRTARAVVEAVCEEFADFAFLDVYGREGRLERIAFETMRLGGDPESMRRFSPPQSAVQHPINQVLRSGRPVIVTKCDDAWIAATSWSAEHAATLRALAIASVAYVPLIAAGERIGVLTLGAVHDTGRGFSDADVGNVEEFASRAAVSLANARLYADLAASEARYRSIIETAQEGVWIVDADAGTRYVNQRLAELLGATPDELYGRTPYEFMDPESADAARRDFETLRDGTSATAEHRLVRPDGGVVWAIVSASPLRDAQGRFTGALQMITDITDRKAIEMQYRLLAEATPQIVWTSDPLGNLTFVNERWTALTGMSRADALGQGWTRMVHRADLARMDAEWRVAREVSDEFEAECRLRGPEGEVYRWQLVRGRARRDARGTVIEWLGSMTDVDTTRRLAKTREIIARAGDVLTRSLDRETLLERFAALLVDELGDEATIRVQGEDPVTYGRTDLPPGVPTLRAVLRHRESELGTVMLRREARFDPGEAALLNELAARAAVAIENALLYEREHRVAVTLQRALLPAVLPDVAGLAFDAVYYPGATDAEIGGDWYDAIALEDGRVVVSIGDVTGRGLTAAVIMGRMRQAIETLATYETDPVRLLDAADAVLRRAHPDAIVTALVGVIDPAERTLTYATAGHPTPFVRAPDGTIRRLPGRGLPLGLRDGHQPPSSTLCLPPSSLAVFFTDGLIEATRDIDEGERRVVAALADHTLAEGAAPAAAIVARVLDDGVRDDVAVLVVRVGDAPVREAPWTLRWRFDSAEPRRAYDVRETFAESLRAFAPEIDLGAAQLVFGELVGNAVRHAPGTVDIALTWDAPSAAVLHVVDDGPGCSPEPSLPTDHAESGRGLYLVQQLTREFAVMKLPGRGAYARAVLLTRTPAG